MEWVDTALGRVPVWGSWSSDRPLVLGIRGAFAERNDLTDLDPPGCDLALLHLPGFHSPALVVTSIGAFIAAFDEVIRTQFSGRQIVAVGLSVGAIVALGLRSPEIGGVLAVEPFFSTAKLWPMIEFIQRLLPRDQVSAHLWAADIFGISIDGVEDRDYHAVLGRQDRPTLALVGDIPLDPRRELRLLPSFTDEADRALLDYRVAAGGHELPMEALREALAPLIPEPELR